MEGTRKSASTNVVPLHKRDPALEQEARTSARLVRAIRNGDAGAETEMVHRYSKGLRYLLERRTRDAERVPDLLHDTFYIAIAKLRELDLDDPERLAGYLRGIAVRVALNAGRARNREPYPMDIDAIGRVPDSEPRQFQHVSRAETLATVRQLLRSMPVERDRDLLTRLYVYDQDKEEICGALGLDSVHFNRVLYRAKARFRKLLEKSVHADEFPQA